QFLADLDSDRAGAKRSIVFSFENLLYLQSIWIDLDDVRRLRTRGRAALAGCQKHSVGGPADVIDSESKRNILPFRRGLAEGQPVKRLAAPGRDVQPFAVFGDLESVCSSGLTAGNNLPALAGVPFPDFAVLFARHHLVAI